MSETPSSVTTTDRFSTPRKHLDLSYRPTARPLSTKSFQMIFPRTWVRVVHLWKIPEDPRQYADRVIAVDRFTELAAIEWHAITSSVLTYGGFERPMKEFMPSKGILSQ